MYQARPLIVVVLIFGLAFLAALDAAVTPELPRVVIDSGPLVGEWAGENQQIATFKGIPFAAPPIGELRWKPPAPVASWRQVRSAAEYSAVCPQPSFDEYLAWLSTTLGGDPTKAPPIGDGSEDCLYLNVWSPDLRETGNLPVMVWIHGGGFVTGTGSTPWYDGSQLAQKGAVVVTINFRLGALGFMAHPELTKESPHRSSGNYGLLDQIAALEWVQRNISAFGGDPGRVTIFGESSGGTAVVYLMTSPMTKGLFHRGIAQSFGDPHVYALSPETDAFSGRSNLSRAEESGLGLAGRLGLEGADHGVESLRQVSAEELAQASVSDQFVSYFVPSVDGWVLPEAPAAVFREGRQHKVPLVAGLTADEGTVLLADPPLGSVEDYERFVREQFGSGAEALLALYPVASPEEIRPTRLRWYQEGCMAGTRYLAASMAKVGSPAYLYVFSRVPPGPGGEAFGAWHFSEVQFIFDTHFPEAFPTGPGDDVLTETMGRLWVRFAAQGDPNGEGLPVWSPYNRSEDRYLELNHESVEKSLSVGEVKALDVMEALFWK